MLTDYAVNVRVNGAAGDCLSDDTAAIQDAIDRCTKQGGGTVYVPAGRYQIGTVRLRSFVRLYLESGASLCASNNPAIYTEGNDRRRARMLIADNVENIAICGQGAIVGTGQDELQRRAGTVYDMVNRPSFRTGGVHFRDCKDVTIRDVRFLDGDSWTLCVESCQNVLIDGVCIRNNYFRTNSDGIDIVSCKDVRVSNCNILSGDDGIVLKTFSQTPCERVTVTNCVVESCATGLKIGTESHGNFYDILFSNCVVRNSYGGAAIFIKDGGYAERIQFNQCIFHTYDDPYSINLTESICPVFVDVERRKPESKLGRVRDLRFSDIQVYSENSIVIQGSKDSPIEDLSLRGVFMRVDKPFDFTKRVKPAGTLYNLDAENRIDYVRQEAYITVANVEGVFFDDLNVVISKEVFNKQPRNAFYGHRLSRGMIRAIRRSPAKGGVQAVCLNNCTDLIMDSSIDR